MKEIGTINVDKDQLLFTSIPYDKDWIVKIDGKKVKPIELLDCLLGIETEINIRKAVFTEEEYLGKKKYYFDPRDVIAKGIKGVQDTVKGLNYSFADKEEDSFYYIRTKIRLFDELSLDRKSVV